MSGTQDEKDEAMKHFTVVLDSQVLMDQQVAAVHYSRMQCVVSVRLCFCVPGGKSGFVFLGATRSSCCEVATLARGGGGGP